MAIYYGEVLRRNCANGTIEVSPEPEPDELAHHHGAPEPFQIHRLNTHARDEYATIITPVHSNFETVKRVLKDTSPKMDVRYMGKVQKLYC